MGAQKLGGVIPTNVWIFTIFCEPKIGGMLPYTQKDLRPEGIRPKVFLRHSDLTPARARAIIQGIKSIVSFIEPPSESTYLLTLTEYMYGCYDMSHKLLETQGLTLNTPAAAGGGEGRLMGEFGLLQICVVGLKHEL